MNRTIEMRIREAWAAEDWELANHWLPEDVRAEAAARGIEAELAAVLALCKTMCPGYLDQAQA